MKTKFQEKEMIERKFLFMRHHFGEHVHPKSLGTSRLRVEREQFFFLSKLSMLVSLARFRREYNL